MHSILLHSFFFILCQNFINAVQRLSIECMMKKNLACVKFMNFSNPLSPFIFMCNNKIFQKHEQHITLPWKTARLKAQSQIFQNNFFFQHDAGTFVEDINSLGKFYLNWRKIRLELQTSQSLDCLVITNERSL